MTEDEPSGCCGADLKLLLALMALMAIIAIPDIVVLEWIMKPVGREHGLPWSTWQMRITLAGETYVILRWWPALWALGILLCAVLALLLRRWEAFVGGVLLFFFGWEDTWYYILQLQPIPERLPWLDASPFLAWTRRITGTPHVSRAGLLLANALALAATAGLVFVLGRRRRARRSGQRR